MVQKSTGFTFLAQENCEAPISFPLSLVKMLYLPRYSFLYEKKRIESHLYELYRLILSSAPQFEPWHRTMPIYAEKFLKAYFKGSSREVFVRKIIAAYLLERVIAGDKSVTYSISKLEAAINSELKNTWDVMAVLLNNVSHRTNPDIFCALSIASLFVDADNAGRLICLAKFIGRDMENMNEKGGSMLILLAADILSNSNDNWIEKSAETEYSSEG